ncbi:Tubulin polyglutamylase complex subunit 2 [Lamellibrachia satsuma]|nr:Tubulin polyglutamylase complex subunit 2 [Lamellibrachia satsuma]
MDDAWKEMFDKLSLGVLRTLEKRKGICDIKMTDRSPVPQSVITTWEQRYTCVMSGDLKGFYMSANGLSIQWKVRMKETRIPVGRLEINPIERLTRIGCSNHNFSMKETSRVPTLLDVDIDSDNGEEDSEISKPRFDHRSRIFELDHCDGFGKVCYVYRNTKPGIPAQTAEVWFLDRALQWHHLAKDFMSYYRLVLMHIGLPQWQYLFTDIGPTPQALQWYHLYCPTRVAADSGASDRLSSTDRQVSPPVNQPDLSKIQRGKIERRKPSSLSSSDKLEKSSSASGPGSKQKKSTSMSAKNASASSGKPSAQTLLSTKAAR